MSARILCPACQVAFAYSPALLGKMVQCRECAHRFTVSRPPFDALPVAVQVPDDAPPVLTPPPLPARPPVPSRPPAADDDDPAEAGLRRPAAGRERPGHAGVLAGLAVAVALGMAVLSGGLVYILWPSTSKGTGAPGPGPTPALVAPVAPEAVPRYEDLIREAPRKGEERRREAAPPAFPPLPGRAGGDGPKFAPVAPLAITPALLTRDRDEIPLPGPVESVAVAAGGRYLLLHVPKAGQVLVFDVNTVKVIRTIGVPDPNALIAGGMNLFVIYQPGKNAVERWGCDTLERQFVGQSPFTDPVKALAMGCASNGPLVAALGGKRKSQLRGATFAYFDPANLNELSYTVAGVENPFGIGPAEKKANIRVSANGRVVLGWSPELPSGTECDVLVGRRATRYWDLHAPRPLLPAPDGSLLFGRGETLRPDLQGGRGQRVDAPVHFLPGVSGNAYVAVRAGSVAICRIGKDAPLVTYDAADDIDLSRADQGLDQTVILVPEARVLITVAGSDRTKLVLRHVDLK